MLHRKRKGVKKAVNGLCRVFWKNSWRRVTVIADGNFAMA
jgi:hypothetical protein